MPFAISARYHPSTYID